MVTPKTIHVKCKIIKFHKLLVVILKIANSAYGCLSIETVYQE